MLARVPIISAYDPRRESMLAYASPSNKIAIMITDLVIDCLGTNNFLVTTSSFTNLVVSLSKQPLVYIYVFFTFLQAYPIMFE